MPRDRHAPSARPPLWQRVRHGEHTVSLMVIAVVCVAVNAPTLVHVVTTNPVQLFAGLQLVPGHGALTGYPTIDPNAGFVTQALGHLSASSWLHGHVPWWNPYEGAGAPLAGEMQSAAFFPPTLLLEGTWGFVLFHLTLEVVAAWSTYFLLRRLGTGRPAAVSAGVAFGLCGTFAWFSHAPANPVAFLPLALLGVEKALQASERPDRGAGAVALLGLAIGLSVVAGFPEVAYVDGLLVALWAVVRLVTAPAAARVRFVGKLAAGGVLGGMLSAPVLVAFLTYLPDANVGSHSGAFANAALAPQALPQLLLPYVQGPIFGLATAGPVDRFGQIWASVGGYLTAALVVCALVGLAGRELRALRLALGVFGALALAKTYGLQPIGHWITHFPGLHYVAFDRYSAPSWEMAVVVLAALGIDDMARGRTRLVVLCASAVVTATFVVWAMASAWGLLSAATGTGHRHLYDLGGGAWALGTVAVVTVGGLLAAGRTGSVTPRSSRQRLGAVLMAAAVCADAAVMFAVPLLSAPPPATVDLSVVRYLQAHLGLHRFATLGPIQPNFGSYFGVAAVNVNDLPVPKAYSRFVKRHLDDNVDPLTFTGTTSLDPAAPSPGEQLWTHLAAYEGAGVEYVVVSSSGTDVAGNPWPPVGEGAAVNLVYSDRVAVVYQLPDPAPFFSTPGVRCAISAQGWDAARVSCPRPATLVRRELALPGWTATVGSHGSAVRTTDDIFQETTVPTGTSTVVFRYAPPHIGWAYAACLVAILFLLFALAVTIRDQTWGTDGRPDSSLR